MRTELIYLWVNKDAHGCFHQEGFNFSSQYSVSYSTETRELRIKTLDRTNVFKNDSIANVTAIIGENGTGKTSLLEYLTSLDNLPLVEETRQEYQNWNRARNELREFIAVYIEQGNAEPRIINVTHDEIVYCGTEIAPYSGEDYRRENYMGQVSHIYLSNGSYDHKRKFYDDTYSRMREMLLPVSADAKFEGIIRYCSTEGQLDNKKIKKLLVGDISVLKDTIAQIGVVEDDDVRTKFETLYKKFCKRKFGKNWAQAIGVTVCPYCNRSYIFTSSKSGTRPQYDHYFPKSKYPYLALSMYNLIPCCAVCNGLKHDENTYETPIVYPYKDSYGVKAMFEESGVDADNIESWLGTAKEYKIEIRYADDIEDELKGKIENAVATFKLEELYSKHSDYVRDILRTAHIYNDDYFEGLVTQYPDLFKNKKEAKNFVFFNYLEERDWGKRVLAKLTHDIAQKVSD